MKTIGMSYAYMLLSISSCLQPYLHPEILHEFSFRVFEDKVVHRMHGSLDKRQNQGKNYHHVLHMDDPK